VREQNGLLVAFATEPGNVAVDQSLYAKALSEELIKPGLEAAQVFRRVRARVREDTRQTQSPEYLDKRDHDFHFQRVPSALAQPQTSEAERAWRWVKDSTNQSVLENFIKEFGGTRFGEEAKVRLAELRKQQVAIATTPSAARPTAPAKEPLLPGLLDKIPDVVLPRDKPAPKPPPQFMVSDMECDPFATSPGIEATVGNKPRCLKPKDTFKDCPECPEMVVVPAGKFTMGSPANEEGRDDDEGPQRQVTIAKPFAVGKFEVTFAEWDACVVTSGCKHKPEDKGWGRGNRPAINVSWDDITKEYLPWLSRKTAKQYRLLSGAEWEYAARAGTTTPFWWGSSISSAQANYDGSKTYGRGFRGDYRNKTVPVDSFEPNPWGFITYTATSLSGSRTARSSLASTIQTIASAMCAGALGAMIQRNFAPRPAACSGRSPGSHSLASEWPERLRSVARSAP
jgi:formylglycine-generating enzyme required for sulfatase activity